jgi:hypothetical protein
LGIVVVLVIAAAVVAPGPPPIPHDKEDCYGQDPARERTTAGGLGEGRREGSDRERLR